MYWTLELASKLEDAPWPATKDELIDYAMRSGAPLEVIENLQEMEDEGEIYESIEDIRQYLMKNNKNYREIKNKIHKIMDRNLNIQKLLDETYLENGLSTVECKDLSQVIVLYNNLQDILEKEIYFKCSMNAYYYLKELE